MRKSEAATKGGVRKPFHLPECDPEPNQPCTMHLGADLHDTADVKASMNSMSCAARRSTARPRCVSNVKSSVRIVDTAADRSRTHCNILHSTLSRITTRTHFCPPPTRRWLSHLRLPPVSQSITNPGTSTLNVTRQRQEDVYLRCARRSVLKFTLSDRRVHTRILSEMGL